MHVLDFYWFTLIDLILNAFSSIKKKMTSENQCENIFETSQNDKPTENKLVFLFFFSSSYQNLSCFLSLLIFDINNYPYRAQRKLLKA